jgi:DnaJ-class molecular chaperone
MALVKCAWCDGTGIDGVGDSPCDVCGGDGHVNAAEPVTSCRRCGGTGKIYNEILEEYGMCGGCSGTGWAG